MGQRKLFDCCFVLLTSSLHCHTPSYTHPHTHSHTHPYTHSANILLDSHLIPKLSDFGLARECHRKPSQQSTYSTQSKVVMGTMAYMAPEFIRNRKLTPKTDVYSFGVVLLELYTGLAADDPSLEERRILVGTLCQITVVCLRLLSSLLLSHLPPLPSYFSFSLLFIPPHFSPPSSSCSTSFSTLTIIIPP